MPHLEGAHGTEPAGHVWRGGAAHHRLQLQRLREGGCQGCAQPGGGRGGALLEVTGVGLVEAGASTGEQQRACIHVRRRPAS